MKVHSEAITELESFRDELYNSRLRVAHLEAIVAKDTPGVREAVKSRRR